MLLMLLILTMLLMLLIFSDASDAPELTMLFRAYATNVVVAGMRAGEGPVLQVRRRAGAVISIIQTLVCGHTAPYPK